MGRISWIGPIEERRIQLKHMGYKARKIAGILSAEFNIHVTKDMITGRSRVAGESISQGPRNQYIKETNNILTDIDTNITHNEVKSEDLFDNSLYDLKDRYIAANETKKEMKRIWTIFEDNKPKKILSLSDLHAPYMDFKNIEKAIRDNLDCNICVLNGDIFDGESMSSFDKMDEIDSSEEFEQVFALLDILTVRFDQIIWVGGNHDYQRFCRYITRNVKSTLRKYAFERLNPMKYISERYPNVIAINNNTLEIGDVVFKHPNGYSGVEMKTVVNECVIQIANKADLPNPNLRMVVIGHTHDAGEYYLNGVKLIEQGCLTHIPDYRFTNPTKRRWTTAYARIELDKDNKVIFNKSHVIHLE